MGLFRKAFRRKYSKLVTEIDVSHGLWIQLLTREVLTGRQIKDCKSYVCYFLRASYAEQTRYFGGRGGDCGGMRGTCPPNIPTGGDDILHVPPKKFTEKSMI